MTHEIYEIICNTRINAHEPLIILYPNPLQYLHTRS